jgi:hypothetical protein
MDKNPNHFPTLLFIGILVSIILYVLSNIVYFIHQRQTTKKAEATSKNSKNISPEGVNDEEQEMTIYLRDQENA